jgi:prevent-host-death family protein
MTTVEQDVPIREARDNLAAIVDAAGAGTVTFITRRGEKVAAVVPVYRARPLPGPATPRIEDMPAARGGRFDRDLADALTTGSSVGAGERHWNRAALEAMHLRLSAALAELVAWQRITGQCLAAAIDGDINDSYLPLALRGQQAADAELARAADLLYALTTPDDAYCATCNQPLDTFHGRPGYQHWREVDADRGVHVEVYTPSDGHTPDVRKRPRERPAITNGAVTPSWRAER